MEEGKYHKAPTFSGELKLNVAEGVGVIFLIGVSTGTFLPLKQLPSRTLQSSLNEYLDSKKKIKIKRHGSSIKHLERCDLVGHEGNKGE